MYMKVRSMIIMGGLVLLGTSCSKGSDMAGEEPTGDDTVDISTITASDAGAVSGVDNKTRTTLDGYNVTWASGDALGCMKVTDNTSNKKFVLSKGEGMIEGEFSAATTGDHLGTGTWIAYYPYTASRYTASKKLRIVSLTQSDETNSHIAKYDWLVSSPIGLGEKDKFANFKMKHVFALIEFNVKLKEATTGYAELAQCVLESSDGSNIFPQSLYFNDQGNIQFDYTSRNISVSRLPYTEFTTNYSTLWALARQSTRKELSVRVYFTYNGVISSAEVKFTPTSILEAGKKYVLNLEMDLDESNPNSSILTILSRQ